MTTTTSANETTRIRLYFAALDADRAWHAELVAKYGSKVAGDARYDGRGVSTAKLRKLKSAKRLADAACSEAAFGSNKREEEQGA